MILRGNRLYVLMIMRHGRMVCPQWKNLISKVRRIKRILGKSIGLIAWMTKSNLHNPLPETNSVLENQTVLPSELIPSLPIFKAKIRADPKVKTLHQDTELHQIVNCPNLKVKRVPDHKLVSAQIVNKINIRCSNLIL